MEERRISGELTNVVKNGSQAIQTAKGLLNRIKARGQALEAEGGTTEAELFIPKYKALCAQYLQTVQRHQAAKAGFKDASKKKILRQGRLIPELDEMGDRDLEAAVERDPQFIQKTMQRTRVANEQVQQAYQNAVSRAQDVEMLIRSLEEVSQMVKEIAELVQQQGEQIDRIVENIENASKYVRAGNQHLENAIKHQRASRKKLCCILIILLVVILIVGGILGGVFGSG